VHEGTHVSLAEDSSEVVANGVDLTVLLNCLFILLLFLFLAIGAQDLLVVFLLSQPKKMLIELCKSFEDGAFSFVVFVILGDLYDRVDNLHNEATVICIIFQFEHLDLLLVVLVLHLLHFNCKIFADLDATSIDEIVLLVLETVDLGDDLSHAGCAAGDRGLGVAVC
jgi:hypothetical protein